MKNKGLFIGIGAAAIIIVVGLVLAMGGKTADNQMTSTTNNNSSQKDTSSAVATTSVNIKDYMFSPMIIKVRVGDKVTWTNQDSVHHNVVADTKSADAPDGPLIGQGETYSFTFKKAGTYTFHCDPHPYMHGTVVVTE